MVMVVGILACQLDRSVGFIDSTFELVPRREKLAQGEVCIEVVGVDLQREIQRVFACLFAPL